MIIYVSLYFVKRAVSPPKNANALFYEWSLALGLDKNNVVVDFSLQDINKPLGVSEYTYTQLPAELREALPTIEQLTEQLNKEDRQ